MDRIKIWFKNAKEPFIMTVLNFIWIMLIVYGEFKSTEEFSYITIVLSSIPFLVCLLITILTNIFIQNIVVKTISNFVSALLVFLIPIYYFIVSLYMLQLGDIAKNNIDSKSQMFEELIFYNNFEDKEYILVKSVINNNNQHKL